MRQVIGVVLLLNAVAVIGAALTGNLPNWPPGQADIHVAEQAGTPLIHLGGEEHPSEGGVISVWNDISISNSIFTMWLVMGILIVIGVLSSRAVSEVPGRFQGLVELIVQGLVNFMKDAGGPRVVRYLPLFGTLFLFALVSNWLFLIPLVGQIELLHVPTADYHTNLGLALTGFIWYQAAGIRQNGWSYFTRWVNFPAFKEGPLVG
ncbi:MAG: F0F1 ATP synthase subunit A, partial [Candidatus Limnocylindria bacterium]